MVGQERCLPGLCASDLGVASNDGDTVSIRFRLSPPKRDAAVGDTVVGESHAWIEAWTGAWWGYDPTNAIAVNEQHVSVGIGRDYSDVPPLKGIFSGGRSTDLEVVVEITRLA